MKGYLVIRKDADDMDDAFLMDDLLPTIHEAKKEAIRRTQQEGGEYTIYEVIPRLQTSTSRSIQFEEINA